MKQIINGKKYNTDTAKEILWWTNGYLPSDYNYIEKVLYKKQNGEYFLYIYGGALTCYAIENGTTRCGAEHILPLSENEAMHYAEILGTVEEYEEEFGTVEE